ncbi:efflux RND transporter permease subunit [Desulfovibrio ferrophilus]|uniref:Acriflavin resistance protein n=1 Tax=Desulfovibrio ferrophilus TaxID=241368 RepID=A0A2Z6AV93_9BACT|nr:efflux RND transporter permease subunit [Desulfovibrio ferrophilus]BBD07106.1 acriflavin resistance protein [Desulfovibrio ferrophilus]
MMDNSKGPIAWMAGNSVASNLIMLICLIGGLIMATMIKQEVFPEFSEDQVSIRVAYSGASPEEVEQGIILAIEDAVQGLDGVDEIDSTASEGSASVTITAQEGADISKLTQDVKSEVDGISTFPDEAEDPVISENTHSREVVSLAVYGEQTELVLRDKADELRDMLLQSPDITIVEFKGVRDHEVHVEIAQAQLRRYGLTLEHVADTIAAAAVETPGGTIRTKGGDVLVRVKERRDWAWEFGRIPLISTEDGSQVLVQDIATVREDFEDSNNYAVYNGQTTVGLDVYRVGDQTPGQVSDATMNIVEQFKASAPEGLDVAVLRDMSDTFNQRAELLLKNAWMGLILVFILLALFLEIRVAFWVSLGIPISFLGAFLFLPSMDLSINMISMFAFIVALGIVVDDAIVVGENIHARREEGMPPLKAAIIGAKEMAMPVTFAVLTNVAAFAPLLFVPGVPGKIFRNIPIVVITVFLISLVESLFVLPAHMAHTKHSATHSTNRLARWHTNFQKKFDAFVINRYGPLLRAALKYRYAVVAGGLALLLIVGAYAGSGRMGFTLFPKTESDLGYCEATLPYGSPASRLEEVRQYLTTVAEAVAIDNGGQALVKSVFSVVSDNTVSLRVYLTDADARPISTAAFINQWRQRSGEIPGLENLTFKSDKGGPGSDPAVNVELSHRNTETLNAAGQTLALELSKFGGASDIDDGSADGKQQLDFHMLPAGLAAGLTAADVASQVRSAFYGAKALAQQRGRNEITVRTLLPKAERATEYSLENMILRTPDGSEIPLTEAVSIERGRAYTQITRHQGRRTIEVTAEVQPTAQATLVLQSLKSDVLPRLMKSVPGLAWSFEGRQADMTESMQSLVVGLLLALLVVYALLAIPFGSYTQPLIIMVCIPFGVVGAILGHLLMGYALCIPSMFGIVALSGVVVNDSLVFINTANSNSEQGQNAFEAATAAGLTRFRPIMLTTLTTFFGLMPMLLETSRQARFMIPMAISLGFGILFATAITLCLVPSLYCILDDATKSIRTYFNGVTPPSPSSAVDKQTLP